MTPGLRFSGLEFRNKFQNSQVLVMESKKSKIVEKPWGREIWFAQEPEYLGKILEIRKGKRSSLQYHKEKKETMYILKGKLRITGEKEEIILQEGDSITLNPGDVHRLVPEEDVIIIEASTYHPKDVVRLEDDYGR